jgi:transmembrane sensor
MDTKQAEAVTQKYLDGTASSEERAIFESWYNQSVHYSSDPMIEPDYKALQQRLAKSLPAGNQKTYKLWPRIAVAAAVALIVLGVYFFNYRNNEILKQVQDDVVVNDIAPGKNTATIKIGDGEAITLSDKQTGVVIAANNLTYNDGSKVSGRHPEFISGSPHSRMTITTPRGGTYQVTLPDGTKVCRSPFKSDNEHNKFFGMLILELSIFIYCYQLKK